MRVELWTTLSQYTSQRPVQGWGWFGLWDAGRVPVQFDQLLHGASPRERPERVLRHAAAGRAGGLLLFALLGGVALVRSWLVASVRRSVVYAWTPLVLVTLAVDSLFESFTLVDAGWFLLVLCALRAGQSRSWRENIDAAQTNTMPTLPGR